VNILDIRTIIFTQLITDAMNSGILFALLKQNGKRFKGLTWWFADLVLQTIAILLVFLRGYIPDAISIGFADVFALLGAFFGLLGLELFFARKQYWFFNLILLTVLFALHWFFTFSVPSLEARDLVFSIGLFIICAQCAWLIFRSISQTFRVQTYSIGIVFAIFCMASLARIVLVLAVPPTTNDFFQSGLYEGLILLIFQMLLIFLTVSLILLVNHSLEKEAYSNEEKFSKIFHNSPYAVLLTRASDGYVVEANESFCAMTGYSKQEILGKTSGEMRFWKNEADRQSVVDQLARGENVHGKESEFRKKTGEYATGLFHSVSLEVGNEKMILSSISDITERKKTDETILASERRYRSLFENMLNGFAYCQMFYKDNEPDDFVYLAVNPAFEKLTGLKDVVGRKVSDVIPGIKQSDPKLFEIYGRVAQTGIPETTEIYVEALKMWFSVSVYSPQREYFVAVFDVITERKQIQEQLTNALEYERTFLEKSPIGIITYKASGETVSYNSAILHIIGGTEEKIRTQNFRSLESWKNSGMLSVAEDALASGTDKSIDAHVVSTFGKEIWMSCRFVPFSHGGEQYLLAMFSDITGKMLAEEEVRQSQENFARAFASNPAALSITRLVDGKIITVNEAYTRILGYAPDEILGRTVSELNMYANPGERDRIIQRLHQQGTVRDYEVLVRNRVGELRNLLLSMEPINYYSEECILSTFLDITDRKRAEADLLASTAKLNAALESMTDAVFISDVDGNFINFNEAFATFHKFKNKSECAKTLAEYPGFLDVYMATGELAPLDMWAVPRALRGEVRLNEEYSLRRKDTGESWTASYSFAPIRDPEGKIVGSVVVGRDITEHKKVEQEIRILNDRLQVLITAIQELAAARDLESVMAAVRTSARKLTGSDGSTFVLRDHDQCYYADEDAISPLWKGQRFPMSVCVSGWVMLNKQPVMIEDIYADPRVPIDAYKPTFVKSLAMVPIRTQDPLGAIGNYWAQHHQPTEMEVQLIQTLADAAARAVENVRLLEELEQRVQERTAQLETANHELEAFSYSVSHDLRAPLRAMSGFSRILAEDYQAQLPSDAVRYLMLIDKNAGQMGELIDDLLRFSRLSRQPLNKQPVAMDELVRQVLEELRAEQEGRQVKVKIGKMPECQADPTLLKQVWVNLLSNALKFTRKCDEAKIEVGYKAHPTPPSTLTGAISDEKTNEVKGIESGAYFVKDNGVGFDMQYVNKLFGVFQRLHRAEDYEGTGVGLAIVQRVIHRHGGQVWAEAAVEKGATFYFTLGDGNDEK